MSAPRCRVCGRSRVALVVEVLSSRWLWSREWDYETRELKSTVLVERNAINRSYMEERRRKAGLLIGGARCLLTEECDALYRAKRTREAAKAKTRAALPEDAVVRELRDAVRGECRWCGETIYRVDKTGRVVIDRRRTWHDGREVHPDAEREERCVFEYHAQKFSFRGQVEQRDHGVCASCGRDCKAEAAAWSEERNAASRAIGHADMGLYDRMREWEREHPPPPGWQADHVVALEDGGEHTLANAQCLCDPCHHAKTAAENSARARRRRPPGDEQARMEVA